MNTNLNTDIRELSVDELDSVSGAKGRATVYEGEVFNIAGTGELEFGVKENPNGTKVPYATWTPTKPK
jgi:hypothetical protein